MKPKTNPHETTCGECGDPIVIAETDVEYVGTHTFFCNKCTTIEFCKSNGGDDWFINVASVNGKLRNYRFKKL
jgi:hypothetical protein